MKTKLFFTLLITVLMSTYAFAETLTFEWNQTDKTNLKEWRLYWSGNSGGPYDQQEVAIIQYDGSGSGPFTNDVTPPDVTGPQGTNVTKYFVLIACGDIPTQFGTTEYKCSENSNEVSHDFWIPAGMFSVPVQFRIIPTP